MAHPRETVTKNRDIFIIEAERMHRRGKRTDEGERIFLTHTQP